MIPVGWDEILFCFVVISGVLKTLPRSYLRLHVKNFIPAKQDPSIVQSGSCFARTKFLHAIVSTRLSLHQFEKMQIRTFQWIEISTAFLRHIWRQYMRQKINKFLYCPLLYFIILWKKNRHSWKLNIFDSMGIVIQTLPLWTTALPIKFRPRQIVFPGQSGQ